MYFQNRLWNATEECEAILKYKTKTSFIPKNSSRVSNQGMLFLPKFAQKWILGLAFRKSNTRFGISSSKIPCVPIFRHTDILTFSAQICPKWISRLEFKKSKSGFGISTSKIPCMPISAKTNNFEFFRLNLGKLPNYVQ